MIHTTNHNPESYQRAIENEYTIIDKNKQEVPFVLNKAQQHLNEQMGEYYDIVILKARKMGFSSFVLAVAVTKWLYGINERCVSVSFDKTAGEKQLERAKHFIKSWELRNNTKIPMKYNSKHELVYEGTGPDGRPYTNTLRIGSARSASFGRGDDITFLHVTEVAFCPDMDALLSGVGEACVANTHRIFETTADGFNDFKEFYDAAERGENGWKALFYGPEWEYTPEFLAEKKRRLGRMFIQEYPPTAEQAFLTSGECFFDTMVLSQMLETSVKNPISQSHEYV